MIIYYILYIQRSDSKAALFLLRQGVDVNLTAEATGSTALHLLTVLQLAAHRYCLLQCILYSVLHLAVHRGLARLQTSHCTVLGWGRENHLTMLLAIWQIFYY